MKSNASDCHELMRNIYIDATMKCTADVSDFRDLETIRSRTENEGLSFLTITLPRFCRAFERSLAIGKIDPAAFVGFELTKSGGIPAFLQGILGQIFSRETGEVIFDESLVNRSVVSDIPTLVESVRQICLTFKKVEDDCTPERVTAALDNFIKIEQEVAEFSCTDRDRSKFLGISDMLWGNMVVDFSTSSITPSHGPGATADRISGNQKFLWRRWHDRLEHHFPLVDFGYPLGIPETSEELEIVTVVPESDEQPVRVVLVPKTQLSPRIIAIEPCCMQFAQQGIRSYLYDKIQSYWLTVGHVNFTDQTVNQKLAIDGSTTGLLATIDLSDASDRVPWSLAKEMFRCNSDLQSCIEACRSTSAHLPDDRVIPILSKFASMGSALCFPVESMYFYTVCVMALLEDSNLSYTYENIFEVSREVYVYGDDIVVPSTKAVVILDYLQRFNCKVNTHKSFWTGRFRESCGVDAFCGEVVTPTYIRQWHPKNKRDARSIVSWVKTANLFYKRGYWRTASYMFAHVEECIGPLPYADERSLALSRISFLGHRSVDRWNEELQRFEMRAWTPSPVFRFDELDGYGALQKCLSILEDRKHDWPIDSEIKWVEADQLIRLAGAIDERHLTRSALHGSVALKRRWVPTH